METGNETALIVRPEEAEYVALPHGGGFRLLADAADADGALGANHLARGKGADGARPHYHTVSTELFYVLDGKVEFLVGEERASVRSAQTA